jgi:hypothetical protein
MNLDFKKMVELSLDKDIGALFEQGRINMMEAMTLQMLRLMRGRPHQVTETVVEGGSADGVKWFPSEPGTSTTGFGPIPPEE